MNVQRSFFLVLLLCFATSAAAQDAFFTGAVSDDWNEPGNWDTLAVPPSGTNALVGDDLFGPNAEASITGDLTEPVIGDLRIGAPGGFSLGNVAGTLNHSAGSLTTVGDAGGGNWSFVGADGTAGAPNIGTYNLSGTGSFNTALGSTEFHIGFGGGADAGTQGFVNISDNAQLNLNRVFVGSNDNNFGTITQTGGSVSANDWLSIGREGGATGTYNISGGSLFVANDFLTVGENSGATGMMNVSGDATIETPNLAVGRFGDGATGTLSIDGPDASISTFSLLVGRDDQNSFNPADATATLRFSSTSDVSPIEALADVYLNDGSVIGGSFLEVDLTGSTVTGNVLLVSVGLNLDGTFSGLPEGASVPNSGGRTITYMGGDGNDIVLLAGGGGVDGDFDDNGMWNCLDIDALVGAIASGSTDLSFDMNGDGVINAADITDAGNGWLAVGGANTPGTPSGNPYLVGDATLDGVVDGLDFIEWNNNKFTSLAEWCSGDFNADGIVDGLDFIQWNNNKFMSSDQIASVPEPAALTLWLCACIALAARRRCNRT